MRSLLKQEFELRLVELEAVDLLVVKCKTLDDSVWVKELLSGSAQP